MNEAKKEFYNKHGIFAQVKTSGDGVTFEDVQKSLHDNIDALVDESDASRVDTDALFSVGEEDEKGS